MSNDSERAAEIEVVLGLLRRDRAGVTKLGASDEFARGWSAGLDLLETRLLARIQKIASVRA